MSDVKEKKVKDASTEELKKEIEEREEDISEEMQLNEEV